MVLAAGVAGVALDGVDDAVLAFFHDADVIGFAVLRAGCAVRVIPVKENDHAGSGFNRVIRPLPVAAEPFNAADAPGEFRGGSRIKITALVKAPRNKAGAPFHTGVKSVPRPIGFTTHIADLRQCYLDDGIIPGINTIENSRPQPAVFLGKQFGKLLPLVGGKVKMLCHFLDRLVADRDIEIGARDRRSGFHDVPMTVVGFGDDFLSLALGAGRDFVHPPENILENGFLAIVHRGDLLRIVGVGGGFYRIHRQHLRPHRTGAGHFQLVIGEICPCGVDLRLIVGIDLLHRLPHGLTRAAVLAGEENAEARTDDQPDHANHKDDNYRNPPACSDSGDQRLCSGNDGFDGGSGSLDRRLNACRSCFCGRTGGMRRSFSGFCRDLCGFLRRFCRYLRRFYGRPGGLLGDLDGFLRGLDRRFSRRFCRLLDGLTAAVYRFDRLLRSIGRAAHPPHGVLRLLFRQVGFSPLKIVLCFGDILLGGLYTLAAGLIQPVNSFVRRRFRPGQSAVGGVFFGRGFRRKNAVLRFVFGADIGILHPLGSHRRFVDHLYRFLDRISRLDVGHGFTSAHCRTHPHRGASSSSGKARYLWGNG